MEYFMKKTIGILAHVDAGKTSFSEQLLYHTNAISSCGRVDHQDTFLDTDEIEKKRGITIFSGLAHFSYKEDTYYLIDTPGHIDFAGEVERSIAVLDFAILVVNAAVGVESHTKTLFQLLKKHHLPVCFFLNKMDLIQADANACMLSIQEKCSKSACLIPSVDLLLNPTESFKEYMADFNDTLLSLFLEDSLTPSILSDTICSAFKKCCLYPCLTGSALNGDGINNFLSVFSILTKTDYHKKEDQQFMAKAFKIQHNKNGERLTFIKILSGKLQPKMLTAYHTQECFLTVPSHKQDNPSYREEKINQIYICHGSRYTSVSQAIAGDIAIVSGLSALPCTNMSDLSLRPALKSKITIKNCNDIHLILKNLHELQSEDPLLHITFEPALNEIHLEIMGKIQLEVLKQYLWDRFSMDVNFEPPEILYKETIASPVAGCGHFEPLRHYAEVHVRMEPAPRGSGILFESRCHVDLLPLHFQHLIETHIFEKEHKGVLTGAPLCDVKIILTKGRFHIKHTEGGDFREATYRAIRQGLSQAKNLLLEPYYTMEIDADSSHMGRILSDIKRLNGVFEPPEQTGNTISIHARGPAVCFMDYPAEFISFTKGNGTITLQMDGYDTCHNTEEVILSKGYDKNGDLDNPCGSIFCHKGAALFVNAEEAPEYMHC